MLFFKQCPVSYNTTYEKIGDEVVPVDTPFDIPDSWEWVRLGNISSYAETKQNGVVPCKCSRKIPKNLLN